MDDAKFINPPATWPVPAEDWVLARSVDAISVPDYREVMWKGGTVYCVRKSGLPRTGEWACIDEATKEITTSCEEP